MDEKLDASELSDAALMRMMQHDDRMGHTILYGRYQTRAMNVAVVLCDDANVASSAIARAFEEVWDRRAEYNPQLGAVHSWLFGIVRFALAEAMDATSASDRVTHLNPSTAETIAINDAALGGRDVANFFGEQLSRLPQAEREVIALAYFGELRHDQIAEMLNLEPVDVKGRMRMGLERLRRISAA